MISGKFEEQESFASDFGKIFAPRPHIRAFLLRESWILG